jgi:hypothetical protein
MALRMLRGHAKIEEQEKPPPPIEVQLRKKPKKRRPLIDVEKREPPEALPPIILTSLQRRGDAPRIVYPQPAPIAAETPIEILHRQNWTARDLAFRKRRDLL